MAMAWEENPRRRVREMRRRAKCVRKKELAVMM
jgi:hypothetical protein